MPTEPNFQVLFDVINKTSVFLARPPVQMQLIALVITVFAAGILSFSIWKLLGPKFQRAASRSDRSWLQAVLRVVIAEARSLSFPILAWLFLMTSLYIFRQRGYLDGLLTGFSWVIATLFVFRVITGLMYAILDAQTGRQYHIYFLRPLLIVLILVELLGHLSDMADIANIVLVTLASIPLTIRAVAIATFGLYFWSMATRAVEDVLHLFATQYAGFDPGNTKAVLTLGRYVALTLGILFALSQFQLDAATVAAITGGLSIGVGFGLREILSNFISGILLLFERSLHPGDVIDMDGQLSVVQSLSVRATTVRTLNNEELVIPNQTFFTAPFKTYTGSERTVRVPIFVNTDCQIDPENVVELLKTTALEHPEVLNDPEPTVFLLEYENNTAKFQVNIWLSNPLVSPRVQSEVKRLIWKAFEDHSVALPFPEMELHFPKQVNVNTLMHGTPSTT